MSENELDRLDSDELIAYIRRADSAGRPECAQDALGVLVFRHYPDVVRRVRIKVPGPDVEDVAMEVMASAIKSAFDGVSIGEFVNWLATITSRRIADYTDKATRRKEHETKLPEEHSEAEDIWGDAAVTPDVGSAVAVEQLIDTLLDELSPPHRMVVEQYVFEDLSAQEAATVVNEAFGDELDKPMSEDNVHKIASRFRERLREELDNAGG